MWKAIKDILFCLIFVFLAACVSEHDATYQQIAAITGLQETKEIYDSSDVSSFGDMVSPDEISEHMDNQDRLYLKDALINTKLGKGMSWTNDKQAIKYTVQLVAEYTSDTRPCRRSLVSAKIDDVIKYAYMTVCRNASGRWEITN